MNRAFGRLPDGKEVDVYTLGPADGLQAEILTLGGTLRSLTLPVKGKRLPLVLSLPDLPAYLKDTSYLGQLVGRYGNRIGGAAFELDGKRYELTANNGPNTLHGGNVGFGKYVWSVLGAGRNQLPIAAQSVSLGGNVRVGLEDSLWIGAGKLAETNAQQVRAARQVIEGLGLEVATPDEAREILQLKGGSNVNF